MKTVKHLIKIIQEDVIGSGNRYMAIAWLVCVTAVIALGLYLGSESRSFLGVADSREQQVTFEYPVSIKQINVISGQRIRKGELLMELDQSELSEKIRLMRAQLTRAQSEKALREQLNMIVSNSSGGDLHDPLSVDIEDFTEQLEALEEQRKNLYIFASFDGIVGAVNFRRGENVPAFTSVMTLSPDSPTYVEGFLHESLRTKLEVGKKVTIVPLSSSSKALEGKIVSVGSRIVLIPTRLMAYPNMQVFGREVVVEIPAHNQLLLGEKVQIKPKFDLIAFSQATASAKEDVQAPGVSQDPQEIKFPSALAKRFSFEPSGTIYLADLKKFLVISDDTDKQKSASMFLMNTDGIVEEQVLTIPGIGKVSDLESISQEGGYIYLLTSQGLNKKGKDKDERNQILRVKRNGLSLYAPEVVDFKPLLQKALKSTKDEKLGKLFKGQNLTDIEIESHFIDGKNMYIGFKQPVSADGQAILVAIENFATVFSTNKLAPEQVKLWYTIPLDKTENGPHRLSDIIKVEGQYFATSVCDGEKNCGAVWRLQSEKEGSLTPTLVKFFGNEKPEGVAFNSHKNSLLVTFDQKGENAKFAWIGLKGVVSVK